MNFPLTRRLKRPAYIFSSDGSQSHADKWRGMLEYGPFQPPHEPHPRIVFLFCEDHRNDANHFYMKLRDGAARYSGLKQFVGVNIDRDNISGVHIPRYLYQRGGADLCDHVFHEISKLDADFAVVLCEQSWKIADNSPYGALKAGLIRASVPSQFVTRQLIHTPKQLQFALPNIAISILAKLGGIPWTIRVKSGEPSLVVGVASSHTRATTETTSKIYGFAVCMLSNGQFLNASFFKAASSHEEFLNLLRSGLEEALQKSYTVSSGLGRVTMHVSQFERRDTQQVIEDVLAQHRKNTDDPTPYEILRLSDQTPFEVYDFDNRHFVPPEGTVIGLNPKQSLLVAEGRKEPAAWSGRKPVTLEISRDYTSSSALKMGDGIRDVFNLSMVNWRGFKERSKPVTLVYARAITDRVRGMVHSHPQIVDALSSDESINSVPWFL